MVAGKGWQRGRESRGPWKGRETVLWKQHLGTWTVTTLPTLDCGVWRTNSPDCRGRQGAWCPQGKPAFARRKVGKEPSGEKLKLRGGLVVGEQAIPEVLVMGVWEVRGYVRGRGVQGEIEKMEY